jgi:hypothetical protein
MLSEKELEEKRKEFRETELQNKINSYSNVGAVEYRQSTLKSNYTYKRVDRRIGKLAFGMIILQALSIVFFSSMYVFTYIPKTKPLVAKLMP